MAGFERVGENKTSTRSFPCDTKSIRVSTLRLSSFRDLVAPHCWRNTIIKHIAPFFFFFFFFLLTLTLTLGICPRCLLTLPRPPLPLPPLPPPSCRPVSLWCCRRKPTNSKIRRCYYRAEKPFSILPTAETMFHETMPPAKKTKRNNKPDKTKLEYDGDCLVFARNPPSIPPFDTPHLTDSPFVFAMITLPGKMAKELIHCEVNTCHCIGRESNPGLAESIDVSKTSTGNGQFYH
jgi:hypothetical protein